ncbi:homoserine O-acetyltransferase [Acidothermaceae bacterium B102]|nr:homoserine O-acetyltransferase [Acidothermaceae bacterium B102]
MAYETFGHPDASLSNAVLVCHALTGDSHVAGEAGWWGGLVGPGRAIDTDRYFVVCPNVLGGCRGTTGPSSPAPDGQAWGSRFPRITVRDQVSVERAVADALGIQWWAAVIGGSMGGMRALEWAATSPSRVGGLFVLATTAAASADQIAWAQTQLAAIRADPAWRDGDYHGGSQPEVGLGIARRIAHLTYRSEAELAARFDRLAQPGEDPYTGGRFAVESYLDHQADKLVRRFDAGSYVTLTEAMNTHDVGRGRGDAKAALAAYRTSEARSVVVAIDSDRLYPPYQQVELADLLGTQLDLVSSLRGHDGFLLETEQVGRLVSGLLAG